jgi:hypothetical protein
MGNCPCSVLLCENKCTEIDLSQKSRNILEYLRDHQETEELDWKAVWARQNYQTSPRENIKIAIKHNFFAFIYLLFIHNVFNTVRVVWAIKRRNIGRLMNNYL